MEFWIVYKFKLSPNKYRNRPRLRLIHLVKVVPDPKQGKHLPSLELLSALIFESFG